MGSIFSTCGCKRDALNYVESARGGDGESDYHRASALKFPKCLLPEDLSCDRVSAGTMASTHLSITTLLEIERKKIMRSVSAGEIFMENMQSKIIVLYFKSYVESFVRIHFFCSSRRAHLALQRYTWRAHRAETMAYLNSSIVHIEFSKESSARISVQQGPRIFGNNEISQSPHTLL
jgi:hypothetical protein